MQQNGIQHLKLLNYINQIRLMLREYMWKLQLLFIKQKTVIRMEGNQSRNQRKKHLSILRYYLLPRKMTWEYWFHL